MYNVKILCVTETHLNSSIKDPEINLHDFRIFRKDRNADKKFGGSCIFVHNTISAELLEEFDAPDSVGIIVKLANFSFKLLCVYRSQNLPENEQKLLLEEISKIRRNDSNELKLFGDFNLPDVNWDTMSVNCCQNSTNRVFSLQREYLDTFTNLGVSPCVQNGTVTRRRLVGNSLQESQLDQVLTSIPDSVVNVDTVSSLGKSDHLGILVGIKATNCFEFIKSTSENWSKFSDDDIRQAGNSIDWTFSEELNSNTMWKELESKLKLISDKVPKETIKCTKSGEILSKKPWDCSMLVRKRKKKDEAWKTFDNFPTSTNLNLALHKQGEYENKQLQQIIEFENKILGNFKTNPKVVYKYLNSKRKIKESVSTLKDKSNNIIKNPRQAATLLADFFSSTFVQEPHVPLEEECYKFTNECIPDLHITFDMVQDVLKKVDKNKSMGPDNIHPKVLAVLSGNTNFVEAVQKLFNKCFSSGEIPKIWKTANVMALHKKGSKMDCANYRPISLTCILCKIYEKIIRSHILKHVLGKISRRQHGFLIGRSCLSNLLEFMDSVNDLLAAGEDLDIFYFDFQKAFDTVPHNRLRIKLETFGIRGKTLNVITDFLSERSFKVLVGNEKSADLPVTSGVPQGSVLGPLLFLLYINDLPDRVSNYVSLFADDLKMHGKSSSQGLNQDDINQLVKWQNIWLLTFNTNDKKCKVMHIGKNNPCHSYHLDGNLLPTVDSEKDLGITVSKTIDWGEHVSNIIKKAKAVTAWVSRSIVSRSPEVMSKIYKSLIRPHLEYCVQLWSPLPSHGNWGLILEIEDVQRSFTRMIDGIGLLSYENRLKALNLTTLLERRARGDLIETFKIRSGLVDYGQKLFKISRNGNNLVSRPGDQNKFKHSFLSRRVIQYWNKLPNDIKSVKTVDSFKNKLQTYKRNNLSASGQYWNLSAEIFQHIDNADRSQYVNFMENNPQVARYRHINIRKL